MIRRLLLTVPLLLLCGSLAHATCTSPCVQAPTPGQNSGVGSLTVSTVLNVTSGNYLYMWTTWVDASATLSGIAKTSGTSTVGSYVPVGSDGSGTTKTTGNDHGNQGYFQVTGTGSITVTCTYSATVSGAARCGLIELTTIVSSSPLDIQGMNAQTNPGLGTNALTSCGSTCNSTQNGDVLVGFNMDFNGNVTTIAAGTGFTSQLPGTGGFNTEYQAQTSSGSAAATFTWQTTGGGDTGITGMIAFKTSSGSAAVANPSVFVVH